MTATRKSIPLESYDHWENMLWLRTSALRRLVVLGILLAVGWLGYLGATVETLTSMRTYLLLVAGPLLLIAVGLLTYRTVERWGVRMAGLLYTLGMVSVILLLLWAYADPFMLFYLALPVGAVGLLFDERAGFFAAGVASLLLAFIPRLGMAPDVPADVIWLTVTFSFVMAAFLWVATYPMRTTLQWAWTSYEHAQQKRAEVQEHRARLMQAVKELNLANRRLSVMASELDRARRAANEARRLKAEFAANISHELRTPLNLIIGFSEMMALAPHTYGEPLPAAYRGDVQAVYRNARHLSSLIDDVLDLSQIEAGRMGLVKTPLRIDEVIDEAINTVALLFQNKGLWLRTCVASEVPVIEADRTRIRQVLINLLGNACRYTERGGVRIEATADAHYVTVRVIDTGVGIRAADLPLVFQQFRQLEGAAPGSQGGSGLGLSICRDFVELHGGRMHVESAPGEGATFSFTLPYRIEWGISRTPPDWETWVRLPEDKERRTVAVLSAEPGLETLFARYLDEYAVMPVQSVDEAWRLAARRAIHALIVVAPSGEAGWLALRNAREALPKLPVLLCTLRGGAVASRPPDVATYLVKPVTQEQFLSALAGLGDAVQSLLIVDDNPEVVRLLDRMVRSAPRSYCVHKAFAGDQALTLLHQQRPDAVILDLLMPEMDGYTVLEQMRADANLRDLPVIVVTAKGQEGETVVAGLVGISQREGFTVGNMMRCLRANLDAIGGPQGLYTGPVSSVDPVG